MLQNSKTPSFFKNKMMFCSEKRPALEKFQGWHKLRVPAGRRGAAGAPAETLLLLFVSGFSRSAILLDIN
ncbi:MAG: hypothetical protein IH614_08055 [Desulfuromonadales bacterium]|nr:hypothetical protein [Desulfuromonadales bacterium]